MSLRFGYLAARFLLGWILCCSAVHAADVTLSVDVGHPSHPISPRLYGVFFEDINFGGDGGLNAELVKNGSFEIPDALLGWTETKPKGATGSVEGRDDGPAFATNPHYLRVSASAPVSGYGVENEGFRGMGVRAGEQYLFSAQARALEVECGLRLTLVSESGKTLTTAEISNLGAEWSEVTAILQPSETVAKARLIVAPTEAGTIDLDMVSLCPEETWENRRHGLRADLVQKLVDLKPSFVRFPGGCIVEGSELKNRYQWKNTIGNLPDRRLIINRWNKEFRHRLTPDYYQSFGLGFYEYFCMAEEMGAEPLPIINCGMACQFNTGELVPLDELPSYIQDALDLIEFANGPVSSTWGAKRAAMGHPKPFGMKLLGVGNEQWGQQYFDRYVLFAKVLKEKHPEIELVSGAGPAPADDRFNFAWPLLRSFKADIVDEHSYAMPDWFLRSATRYDDYDRRGPKIFMGEYAAQSVDICSPDNRNDLRCALAEAAFMTGLERNSDIVVMSSYAPLFGHEEAWQWRPNLIWFDNLESYATPNYYVQQLFSQNRGDTVLPVDVGDPRPPVSPLGRIGVGTDQASAEFKDIRVSRGDESLFSGDSLADVAEATVFRGKWTIRDGLFQQQDPRADSRTRFGDYGWSDSTLTLKARKLAGQGGIRIIFRNSSGGSFLEWDLGGRDNRQYSLRANVASHELNPAIVQQVSGSIEPERWYDIKIERTGSRVRCHLDGDLVHDVDVAPPNLPRLFATASRDDKSGQIIVKVVNPTDNATSIDVKLSGIERVGSTGRVLLLQGHPDDENSLAEPTRLKPLTEALNVSGPNFEYTFRPQSLTILRLDAN